MPDLAALELRIESRQVGRASSELGRFVKSGKDAERSASRFEKSARRLSGTAGVLGGSLGGLVPILGILGAKAGFGGVVGILRDFEDGLVGVSKTTGLAGSGLRELEADIERMATNSGTAIDGLFGITEAAGQLGIRGRDSLGGFTDAISKLADASPSLRSNIEGTALSMGKLLSITGASADDTFNLASVIAQLEDSYSTVANKILGTGLEVAKAGAAYDVSAQQALGLAAAFDAIGTEAELSRSAVVSVFGEMSKAIATSSPKLATFATLAGKSIEEFTTGFRADAVGGFQDFVVGLDQIIQQGGEAGLVLNDLGLGSKRLQPTLLTLAKDSQRLGDILGTASDEFASGGKLQREFEAGSDTLSKSLVRLSNTFKILVDNLLDDYTKFAGALRQTVETGTDVLRVLADMENQVRGNVEGARFLAGGIVGLTGALGAYVAVQAVATAGAFAFSAVTLATPFGAIALAIGAAAGALFVYKDNFVELGDEFATVGSSVGAAFEVGLDRLGIAMKIGVKVVSLGWEAILDATSAGLDGFLASMTGTVLPFGLKWTDFWDSIVNVVRISINRTVGLAKGGLLVVEDMFTRFSTVADDFKLLLSGEATAFETLAAGGRIAKALTPKDILDTNSPEFLETLGKDYIKDAATAGTEAASAFGVSFGESLKTSLSLQGFDLEAALKEFDPEKIAKDFRDKAVVPVKDFAAAVGKIDQLVLPLVFGFKLLGDEVQSTEEKGEGLNAKMRDLSSILEAGFLKGFEAKSSQAIENIIIKVEDLGFALEHALESDLDQRKALALRDLGFELDAAGKSGDEAATFLDGFGTAIDRLDQLERIKDISREFATEMGGAFKGLITGAESFEDSINSLGRAISDIALDRFLIDPAVDGLTDLIAGFGADLTAKDGGDVSGAGALGGALEGLLGPSATFGASLGSAVIQLSAFTAALAATTAAATNAAGGELAESFVGPLEESAASGITGAESALSGLQTPAVGASAAMGTVTSAATSLAAALLAAASAASGSAAAGVAGGVAGAASTSALGNLFSGSGIHRFAQGGAFAGGRGLRGSIGDMLTNGPVTFPMGVAGEAGPEAILPANRLGGGFSVNGIFGNERFPLGLTRDSSGSLVVDLGSLKQKPRPFKDGAAFNRGFTPPISSPSSRGAQGGEGQRGGDTYQDNRTFNIKTPDPKSFGRSMKQTRTDMSRALTGRRPN